MAETLTIISIISFVLAGVFFLLAIFFWFKFKIPQVVGDLSGKTATKSIEKMRASNAAGGAKLFNQMNNINTSNELKVKKANEATIGHAQGHSGTMTLDLAGEETEFIVDETALLQPQGMPIEEETELLQPLGTPDEEETELLQPLEEPDEEETAPLQPLEEPDEEETAPLQPLEEPDEEETAPLQPLEEPDEEETAPLQPLEMPVEEEPEPETVVAYADDETTMLDIEGGTELLDGNEESIPVTRPEVEQMGVIEEIILIHTEEYID